MGSVWDGTGKNFVQMDVIPQLSQSLRADIEERLESDIFRIEFFFCRDLKNLKRFCQNDD